jgi:hypothetical protein
MAAFHSRFGTDAVNADLKAAFMQHIIEEMTYVFTTGPLRSQYFLDGGKTAPHAHADATLSEVARDTTSTIELVYLSGAQEAGYGFDTMLEHSKAILDDAIEKAGITSNEVGVTHAGTTSFQTGVYNRATGEVSHLNSFDYGTNNPNTEGFAELCAWMAATPVQDFVSFGSESYAAPDGKIATNKIDTKNAFHSELNSLARAYAAAQRTMTATAEMGKSYYIPERKAWEAKTSATLALRKMYPTGTLIDWGGGQIKNEETGLKITFDQRTLF